MTKSVRIEDADTGTAVKMRATIYDKGVVKAKPDDPDHMVEEYIFNGPTDLRTFYTTSTRYIVIDEVPVPPSPQRLTIPRGTPS